MENLENPLFEVKEIPEKGKGLVARSDIAEGTRILCEKRLFTVRSRALEEVQRDIAAKIQALSREEQRQFFSLHNNFLGRFALAGIVKTNALPCGPDSPVGGVYLTACRINHSCLPNCHHNWNPDARHETIHAIRPIAAGEEITISYENGRPSAARRAFLSVSFGFDCECTKCSVDKPEREAGDARRILIERLDEAIGDPSRMMSRPVESLRDCHKLIQVLGEEFEGYAGALNARVYYDAFQVCIAHGDQARASVMAERAYKFRVACEGEDSPETKKVKGLSIKPADHASFGSYSMNWRSKKTMVPKGLDAAQFNRWLFKLLG